MNFFIRIVKGIFIWFAITFILFLILSSVFPSDMPLFFSFFVLIFPVYCAVHFSKSKQKDGKKQKRPKNKASSVAPVKSSSAQHSSHAKPNTHSTSMDYIDTMEGHDFEEFVAGLLRKLGYERVKVTPGSGDQGVDIVAVKNDKKYAIQCKRYSHKLGNKPVQEVYAGKTIYGCSIAVVVTNNYFTEGAKEAARSVGVELWDRDTLKRMITYAEFKDGK